MTPLIRGPRNSRPIDAVAARGHRALDMALAEAIHRDDDYKSSLMLADFRTYREDNPIEESDQGRG